MGTCFTLTTDPQILEDLKDYPQGDPHCHTVYSDGCIQLKTLVKLAKKQRMSVVMKEDHNTTKGNDYLAQYSQEAGLLAIPGIEISTKIGHMVGINLNSWKHGGGDAQNCIENIHKEGGAAIMAHPWWKIGAREETFKFKDLDGFEGLNHSSPLGGLHFLRKIYKKGIFERINPYQIPVWCGSDSHGGIVFGQFRVFFLTTDWSVDGIMEAIFKGNIRAYGPLLPIWGLITDGWINQPVQLKKVIMNL